MHPSNPLPEPNLFTHTTPQRHAREAVNVHTPTNPIADTEAHCCPEELEDLERWDGLS
jgi:hypothetical protein